MKARETPVHSICLGIGTVIFACVVHLSLVVGSCIADEVTLTPTADTFVDEYNPNTPQGSYTTMRVAASWSTSGNDDMARIAFLRFDYSSIPQGSTINYAEFRLTRQESGWVVNPGVLLGVGGLSKPNWSESTLTWNNGPFIGPTPEPLLGTELIGTLRLGTATSWVWKDTDFVNKLSYVIDKVVNDYANFPTWKTWVLQGADWGCGQIFATRENSSSNLRPQLYIRFTPPQETISAPTSITGPSTVVVNSNREYCASGASSSLGHSVQYRFDKGDGSSPTIWDNDGDGCLYLGWSNPGSYGVKAQARCATHTDKESAWSGVLKTVRVISPPITVTSPNGGESWPRGSTQNITWGYTADAGSYVKIELYKRDSFHSTIASSTGNDGSYLWTLPTSLAVSDDYLVKVTSTIDEFFYDYGDAWFSIAEEHVKPMVSIVASDPDASEPANNGYFTVSRTGSTSETLRVYYGTSGSTATAGSDYAALPGYVDIPAGQSSALISVVVIDDSSVEGSETVKVTLSSNAAYDIDPSKSYAIVTIADDYRSPTISGYIRTSDGDGIAGVTMTGWPGTDPVTGDNGYYNGTVPYGWSGTITPSKSGYTFEPTSKPYSSVTSDKSNENYIGTPPVTWSFVQITDTHIGASGKHCVPVPLPGGGTFIYCYPPWNARTNLAAVLHKVVKEVKPAFIVNTGDVADYGCYYQKVEKCADSLYKCYNEVVKQFCTDKGIRVYNIIGNHDQRGPNLEYCEQTFPSCFSVPDNPKNRFISGRTSFWDYDDSILFVTLNTGCNHCRGVLTQEDIDFLNGLNKDIRKIILTHHPAVADESDRLGISELCAIGQDVHIVDFQTQFLNYCRKTSNNNVAAVLSGHTHTSKEYDENLQTPIDYPQYIITGTAGKAAVPDKYPVYRKIDVIGNEVKINNVTQLTEKDYDSVDYQVCSSANLHVYDSSGRHTGFDSLNGFESGIPDSVYFSNYDVEDANGISCVPEEVIIFDPCDNYLTQLVGTETGPYRLVISSVKDGNGVIFEANDIPTLPGAVHDFVVDWNAVSAGQQGVTIGVDEDGDGVPEKTITSDGKLTGDEFVSEWPKLNDYVTIQVGEAGYDHQKKRLGVNVTVTNTSGETLGIPLWVVVESVSEPNVTLADANGVTSKDKNYADLSELLLNDMQLGKLGPGESITKRIYFNNPDGVRFTFEPSVRGVILSQGEGTGFGDLARLSGHWLGNEPALDVAPAGGDGIINLRDFAVMAEHWLEGK